MIRRRASDASIETAIRWHAFCATGTRLTHWRPDRGHATYGRTQERRPYDGRNDDTGVGEVKIGIWSSAKSRGPSGPKLDTLFAMQAKSVFVVLLVMTIAACQTTAPSKPPAAAAAAAETAHYDGFVIRAKRSVKAGDAIPVLVVGDTSGAAAMSVLSVEAAEGAMEPSKAEPWFTAFPEATTMHDRAAAVEAWRIEKGDVTSPLGGTSFAGTITVKADPSAANKAFACSFNQEGGEVFAAYTSEGGARSTNTMPVADGADEAQFPFMATLKCSDGNFRTVLPALLRAKADIRNNAGVLTISPSGTTPNDIPLTNNGLIPGAAGPSLWCRKEDTYHNYLRFYPGGTVIEVTAGGTGAPSEKWFNETWKKSGKYSISGSSVKFSIGTYDYDGVLQGSSLQLRVHSPINNRPARQDRYEPCH